VHVIIVFNSVKIYLIREEFFAEFNITDEQFSDENFAHFDPLDHP